MVIEINEEELQEWAVNQIKTRMGDRINTLMREWDWERYMRGAVDKVVREKVTDEAIQTVIGNVDKDSLIKTISETIAIEVADCLQN